MSWFDSTPANPATVPTASIVSPKTNALGDDKYRLALANALMQSALEPTENKKAGQFAVPTSPWETLSKLGQGAAAAYMMKGK